MEPYEYKELFWLSTIIKNLHREFLIKKNPTIQNEMCDSGHSSHAYIGVHQYFVLIV
jgi:hypothetical protein